MVVAVMRALVRPSFNCQAAHARGASRASGPRSLQRARCLLRGNVTVSSKSVCQTAVHPGRAVFRNTPQDATSSLRRTPLFFSGFIWPAKPLGNGHWLSVFHLRSMELFLLSETCCAESR